MSVLLADNIISLGLESIVEVESLTTSSIIQTRKRKLPSNPDCMIKTQSINLSQFPSQEVSCLPLVTGNNTSLTSLSFNPSKLPRINNYPNSSTNIQQNGYTRERLLKELDVFSLLQKIDTFQKNFIIQCVTLVVTSPTEENKMVGRVMSKASKMFLFHPPIRVYSLETSYWNGAFKNGFYMIQHTGKQAWTKDLFHLVKDEVISNNVIEDYESDIIFVEENIITKDITRNISYGIHSAPVILQSNSSFQWYVKITNTPVNYAISQFIDFLKYIAYGYNQGSPALSHRYCHLLALISTLMTEFSTKSYTHAQFMKQVCYLARRNLYSMSQAKLCQSGLFISMKEPCHASKRYVPNTKIELKVTDDWWDLLNEPYKTHDIDVKEKMVNSLPLSGLSDLHFRNLTSHMRSIKQDEELREFYKNNIPYEGRAGYGHPFNIFNMNSLITRIAAVLSSVIITSRKASSTQYDCIRGDTERFVKRLLQCVLVTKDTCVLMSSFCSSTIQMLSSFHKLKKQVKKYIDYHVYVYELDTYFNNNDQECLLMPVPNPLLHESFSVEVLENLIGNVSENAGGRPVRSYIPVFINWIRECIPDITMQYFHPLSTRLEFSPQHAYAYMEHCIHYTELHIAKQLYRSDVIRKKTVPNAIVNIKDYMNLWENTFHLVFFNSLSIFLRLYRNNSFLVCQKNWYKIWFVCYLLSYKILLDQYFHIEIMSDDGSTEKTFDLYEKLMQGKETVSDYINAEGSICFYLDYNFEMLK